MFASPAFADNSNSSLKSPPKHFGFIRNFITTRRHLPAPQPTLTSDRLQARNNKLQSLYNDIRKGFADRFTLLNTYQSKISTSLASKKSAGINVSNAEAKLATYNQTTYNNDLSVFDQKFTSLISSTDPGLSSKDLQQSAKTVRSDLQNLQKILVDTMRLVIISK